MNQDFSELIQYLGEKFTHIDGRFNGVDEKFTHIDGRFNGVDEKFTHIDERFNEIKTDFNDLQTSVDAYAKKADTYFQEMVMLFHKVDRHEKWFHQIAEKLGLKLEY